MRKINMVRFAGAVAALAVLTAVVIGCGGGASGGGVTPTVGAFTNAAPSNARAIVAQKALQAIGTRQMPGSTLAGAPNLSAVTPQAVTVGAASGDNGITQVNVRAAYDSNNLYFQCDWLDATESVKKNWLVFNGTTWSKSGDEDRLALFFDIGGTAAGNGGDGGTFAQKGCQAMCHADGMRTTSGTLDEWHTKMARSTPAGYSDDKWIDNTVNPADVEAGHHGDAGQNTYSGNNGANNVPKLVWNGAMSLGANFLVGEEGVALAGDPVAGATAYAANCAACHGAQAQGGAGPALASYLLSHSVSTASTKITTGTMAAYAKGVAPANYVAYLQTLPGVPGSALREAQGSRADVRARAAYANGGWTVIIWRALNTGNVDDVVFNPAGGAIPIALAVMDNNGAAHNGTQGPWTVEFAQ
ncbi:MAG: hypothetical protein GW911_16920 [Armatimonadetes bacterium]|nr:hypothetical protein [Armatimonadota bacterium]NCO95085.1 hypothetical protein [Armatimonadota bacterium]NCP31136.1 hypothetical protein [Armatimonadota bacterium]NCQ32035.1 hypothetical protein [Armatimonadota bacterium]NDK13711.1 hypothetical protein [Armatimonadota bacterium]